MIQRAEKLLKPRILLKHFSKPRLGFCVRRAAQAHRVAEDLEAVQLLLLLAEGGPRRRVGVEGLGDGRLLMLARTLDRARPLRRGRLRCARVSEYRFTRLVCLHSVVS